MNRKTRADRLYAGMGIAIGVLWIAMALTALWSAVRGLQNQRSDWALGWGLVGVLLLIAGVAALVGTWWHQTRVKRHYHV